MNVDHESFADFYVCAVAGFDQLEHFGGIEAERFFAQYMLARFGCANRPRHVHVIRQRIVDEIDGGIGQELFVGAVRGGDAELRRGFLCAGQIARGNRRDFGAFAFLHRGNHFHSADFGDAQYSDADLFCHGASSYIQRLMKFVSKVPATKSGSFRMRLWSGIEVWIPSTTNRSRARFMRAIASLRSAP